MPFPFHSKREHFTFHLPQPYSQEYSPTSPSLAHQIHYRVSRHWVHILLYHQYLHYQHQNQWIIKSRKLLFILPIGLNYDWGSPWVLTSYLFHQPWYHQKYNFLSTVGKRWTTVLMFFFLYSYVYCYCLIEASPATKLSHQMSHTYQYSWLWHTPIYCFTFLKPNVFAYSKLQLIFLSCTYIEQSTL